MTRVRIAVTGKFRPTRSSEIGTYESFREVDSRRASMEMTVLGPRGVGGLVIEFEGGSAKPWR
jgi:hypothetical protein